MTHIVNSAADLSECELMTHTEDGGKSWTLTDTRADDESFGTIGHFSNEDTAYRYARSKGGELDDITIKLTTAAGTNASEVADAHCHGEFAGRVGWSGSVDNCDCEGEGRVFITCEYPGDAKYIASQLVEDDAVTDYEFC